MKTPLVLAVDIGSSSVKAGLFDAEARSLTGMEASARHAQTVASDGTSEEPVERIAGAVESCIDQVLDAAGDLAREIGGVGMDCMASTILGVDREGRAVTPVYTYADTRSAEDVERLKQELDVPAVYDRTGVMQHTSYVPARVRWLERTDPQRFERVQRWLDVSTFLFTCWFGDTDIAASYSVASWSGMLNRHELEWDAELLGHLGLTPANLPGLRSYTTPTSGLCDSFADRWPALSDVPFFPAVGDGAAVNVGAGCVSATRVALTVGTTSAMRVIVRGAPSPVPQGLWAYRLGRDASLFGGAFSEGGVLVEWAQRTLQLPPLAQLDGELSKLEPDGHGLTVLPFLAGERATGWSTRATGVYEGIRVSTTPLEMLQAALEAVSLRFSLVADLLLPEGRQDTRFIATGGAVRSSEWWLQAMADSLGADVSVTGEAQETSRGAAVLALHGLGVWSGLDDFLPEIVKSYEPRPAMTSRYRRALDRQKSLYHRVLG